MRVPRASWVWIVAWLAVGCAGVISENLRMQAERDATPEAVFAAPDRYRGKIVIWGGEIVAVRNAKSGATLELLSRPLSGRDQPRRDQPPGRRFLVEHDRFIDPQIFHRGLDVTVAGEVVGVRTQPLDETEYTYPVLRARELHRWEPGAGSPVRFGIGFGFGSVITR